MKIYKFSLNLSAEEIRLYYSGERKYVHVSGGSGPSIQFPANQLRQFVTHDGVHGEFEIKVDKNHKLIGIRRVD